MIPKRVQNLGHLLESQPLLIGKLESAELGPTANEFPKFLLESKGVAYHSISRVPPSINVVPDLLGGRHGFPLLTTLWTSCDPQYQKPDLNDCAFRAMDPSEAIVSFRDHFVQHVLRLFDRPSFQRREKLLANEIDDMGKARYASVEPSGASFEIHGLHHRTFFKSEVCKNSHNVPLFPALSPVMVRSFETPPASLPGILKNSPQNEPFRYR